MAQSRRGVTHILEVQMHLLAVVIPRFILIEKPLPPLHAMAQALIEPLRVRAAKALVVE
jgi:hypothetical protein